MKQHFLSLILLFFLTGAFCQSKDSFIQIRHGYFGNRYYQNDKKLSTTELNEVLRSNEEAYKQMQSSRTNSTLYYVLGIPGAVMFGYGIVPDNIYAEPKWGLVAAGAAMSITSFVLYFKSKNQAQKAIELYNNGLRKTSLHQTQLRFGVQGNKFGLFVSF